MSRGNLTLLGQTEVQIADAAAAIPAPGVAGIVGGIVTHWNRSINGGASPPLGEINVSSDATESFIDLEMLSGTLVAETAADDTFTAATTDIVTETTHNLTTGSGPFQLTNSGGALPAGLALLTDYWVRIIDANTYKFHTSLANALKANSTAVDVTGTGTGTHTRAKTSGTTKKIEWFSLGLLGQNGDGVVAITASKSWRQRFKHSPQVDIYAITSSAPTGSITAEVRALQEN